MKNSIIKIVGSTLIKSPRDLDIVLVIPDSSFKRVFGLTAKQWSEEGDTGNWSNKRWYWAKESTRLGKLLERRIKKALFKYPLDFKIIPKSEDKKTAPKILRTTNGKVVRLLPKPILNCPK